ncbi:MAG: flavodoxin family protein [Halanaerobiales bacterium]
MKIMGIVGSPRKEKGLTHQIVEKALKGAAAEGADTELVYLRDYNPDYCIHCDYDCFSELECRQEDDLNLLYRKVENCNGLVLGAPVYIWQTNALTISFIEKMRLKTGPWNVERENHKTALGIAVAGGTGTGVFPALKSIYSFFNLWKFNPLPPLPVTRFNFEKALKQAEKQGTKLGKNISEDISDPAEIMAAYDNFEYLDFKRRDEFRWLAEKVVQNIKENYSVTGEILDDIESLIEKGDNELNNKNQGKAIRNYMRAYQKAKKIRQDNS